jgi:hypothetical protein
MAFYGGQKTIWIPYFFFLVSTAWGFASPLILDSVGKSASFLSMFTLVMARKQRSYKL